MEVVTLGLGANRSFNNSSPVQTLLLAVRALRSVLSDLRFSSVYQTGALYVTDQADFYNMVVRGGFEGSPQTLLSCIHDIENRYGRDRSQEIRNGPRTLDIDIELFGNTLVHQKNLIIPHERMLERAFVLLPLVEILRNSADTERSGLSLYESCLEREAVRAQKISKFLDAAEFQAQL
jgi:2-amino-4-hydroxy-6-hydroxymethyldihydropteridine diphosphokinase